MRIKIAPDVFRQVMSKPIQKLEYVRTYLEDRINKDFKDHLIKLEMVLARLSVAVMKIDADKSKFLTDEVEYLGYWITCKGTIRYTKKWRL
jgi:hypothetical protein